MESSSLEEFFSGVKNMNLDIVKRYIAMPMAIQVFKQDIERFKEFKLGNLYQDMLESIIERMQQDFRQLKSELRSQHIDVRKLDIGKYKVNNEVFEFTPEELKEMTSKLMSDYLYGENTEGFERMDRTWKR